MSTKISRLLVLLLFGSFVTTFLLFVSITEKERQLPEPLESFADSLQRQIQSKLSSNLQFDSIDRETNVLIARLLSDQRVPKLSDGDALRMAANWVTAKYIVPERAPLLGDVLVAMRSRPVKRADLSRRGSQLKLELELEGGWKAFFKPKRYAIEDRVFGLYEGFDRHNGEIVSFHLSRLMALPAPIVVSRALQFSEVTRLATPALRNAIYGQCIRKRREQVCAQSDVLEGALILELPFPLRKTRHPWQRTYKKNVTALWENDSKFCEKKVLPKFPSETVLDLIDISIFDFLIQNADRHHFERFRDLPNSAILLIDNGKSFGDSSAKELSILYPLAQCCHIRRSTLHKLRLLATHGLGSALKTLLKDDPFWPLLTDDHLRALDSRLRIVLAVVSMCEERGGQVVVE